jgi:adenylate cyclase
MPLTPSALDLALNRCASAESATRPPGPDLGPLAAVAAGPSDSQLGLSPAQLNRRRTEEDKRLAQDLLRSRRVRGSYTVSLAALLVCLISLPFCLYVGLRFQSRLGLSLIGLTMAAAAYEGVMLILLRCGRHRPWLDWVNVSLEVSVVSGAVLLDAHYLGPAYAFTSAPLLLYGPVILLSALRLSRTLTIYAGLLAGLQLLCSYAAYAPLLDPAAVRLVPSLTTANLVQRACYLGLSGLLAAWLCATFTAVLREFIEMVRRELRTRTTLGRHVSREVARHLLDHSQDGGEQRHLSVLFCDVRDFTAFSESRDPRDVLHFLNQLFPLANRIVEQHGGVINKFLGDGFLALFGATAVVPQAEHARQAAQAALALVGGLGELRRTWSWPELRIGVGIHSGVAVVGTVGSIDRLEFTAIGDTVNLASRIESLCKTYGVQLLVSGSTAQLLGGAALTRRLGATPVKGRRAPAEVHELLGLAPGDCAEVAVSRPSAVSSPRRAKPDADRGPLPATRISQPPLVPI